MMNEKGFTLIELLLVLSIMVILISIIVPRQFTSLTKQSEKLFIEQLHSDVLFIQNQSHLLSKAPIFIRFYPNNYTVNLGIKGAVAKREFPEGWSFRGQDKDTLEFHHSGTVRKPRKVRLYTNEGYIFFVFSFGKGRFYVDETERIYTD